MRLTAEQIKQAMLHDDAGVRHAAISYFTQSFTRDASLVDVAMQAIEKYGWRGAFEYMYPISELPQNELSLAWAIDQLHRMEERPDEDRRLWFSHLSNLIVNADVELIRPVEVEIRGLNSLTASAREQFEQRLRLATLDGEALWRELDEICDAGRSAWSDSDFPFARGEWIVEALARQGTVHAERMMSLLDQDVDDYTDNPYVWLELYMVQLAGLMRYAPALPKVFHKFEIDDDYMLEECPEAMIRIGGDDVIRLACASWPKWSDTCRLHACCLFGQIHSDEAIVLGLRLIDRELFEWEEDDDGYGLDEWLMTDLVEQFSTETLERALAMMNDFGATPDLLATIKPVAKLLGFPLPELENWKPDLASNSWRFPPPPTDADDDLAVVDLCSFPDPGLIDVFQDVDQEPIDDARPQPIRVEHGPGRNDPCPCGSGKKYKKCCLHKANSAAD